jgi:DNA ligase-1
LPMLAQSWDKSGHRIKFPSLGQPKFNGVRCLAKRTGDTIDFGSRKGKSYTPTLTHLIPELLTKIKDGQVFDGEVYIHGLSLQTIVSYVKKLRPESKLLQYYVYDLVDENMTFEDRYNVYSGQIEMNPSLNIVSVPCVELKSAEDLKPVHDSFVKDGFEGLIIRNRKGKYLLDHRSADLQKYKAFLDSEFEIVGGRTPETGRMAGGCVFLCKTPEGKTFECCPRGTTEIRRQYYKDLPKLLNKKATVRYFNLSDDGIPLFPVMLCVRDYE